MVDLVRTCKRCNRKVPAREVRMSPDGGFICFACAGFNPQSSDGSSRSVNAPHVIKHDGSAREKTKYQCMKCKYEFYLKEGHAQKCPYCSGSNIQEKSSEAQRLLDLNIPMRDDRS